MKDYTTKVPNFTEVLPLFETTTPGHADNFNDVNKIIFENTLYLYNKMLEAHKVTVFDNLREMVAGVNAAEPESFQIGDNILIVEVDVPDLWVADIQSNKTDYHYTNDEMLVDELTTNGTLQCGIYTLARLEIGKIDLSEIQSNISKLQEQLSGVETALASI